MQTFKRAEHPVTPLWSRRLWSSPSRTIVKYEKDTRARAFSHWIKSMLSLKMIPSSKHATIQAKEPIDEGEIEFGEY